MLYTRLKVVLATFLLLLGASSAKSISLLRDSDIENSLKKLAQPILNAAGENFLTQLWHLWYISRLLRIKGQSYRNGAKRKGRPYFMAFLALQLTRTRSSSWHWASHPYTQSGLIRNDAKSH